MRARLAAPLCRVVWISHASSSSIQAALGPRTSDHRVKKHRGTDKRTGKTKEGGLALTDESRVSTDHHKDDPSSGFTATDNNVGGGGPQAIEMQPWGDVPHAIKTAVSRLEDLVPASRHVQSTSSGAYFTVHLKAYIVPVRVYGGFKTPSFRNRLNFRSFMPVVPHGQQAPGSGSAGGEQDTTGRVIESTDMDSESGTPLTPEETNKAAPPVERGQTSKPLGKGIEKTAPSAQGVTTAPVPRFRGDKCVNCKRTDHRVADCLWASRIDGTIHGCPIHNSASHSIDKCTVFCNLDLATMMARLFTGRAHRPPYHTATPGFWWIVAMIAADRDVPTPDEPFPCTPEFARAFVANPANHPDLERGSANGAWGSTVNSVVDPDTRDLEAAYQAYTMGKIGAITDMAQVGQDIKDFLYGRPLTHSSNRLAEAMSSSTTSTQNPQGWAEGSSAAQISRQSQSQDTSNRSSDAGLERRIPSRAPDVVWVDEIPNSYKGIANAIARHLVGDLSDEDDAL